MERASSSIESHSRVDGDGPWVTLIHGVGAATDGWDGIVSALSGRFRFLRYDLRGHGRSPVPPAPYSLDDFVADLAALLDERDIASTALVGHSLGGIIGQAFALRYPERVSKLVLISTAAGRTAEERKAVLGLVETLESEGAAAIMDRAIGRWFTPVFAEAHPDVIERRKRRVMATDPAAFASAFRVYAECDFGDEIGAIRTPTLVMTGEHDPGANQRMARHMHARIPGSRLHVLTGLRHAVLLEAPTLVAAAVGAFLAAQ